MSRVHFLGRIALAPAITALLCLIFLTAAALFFASGRPAAASPAGTAVCDPIVADTHWMLAGSPYTVCGAFAVTVAKGVTLTVDPGVVVQFEANGRLDVAGTLAATGAETQPITFTGVTPAPGSWQGLTIVGALGEPNTGSVLRYVTVEYGGTGTANSANLSLESAQIDIAYSTFRHGGKHGIFARSALANIADSGFFDNGPANAGFAVLFEDGSVKPVLARLAAAGNGVNGIGLGGHAYLEGEHLWAQMGLPYVILGGITVNQDARLTIAPGVEIRFAQVEGLEVRGRLDALGLPGLPITFTGTTQAPGWWDGITVAGAATAPAMARFDYVTVEYGGADAANLAVSHGQLAFGHGAIRYSSRHGVKANGSTRITIAASALVSNTEYGVYNGSSAETDIVDAANNWWGSAAGPLVDGGCNPGGAGSRVTAGSVIFRPYFPSADQPIPPGPVPGDALILTLTPLRWFVPADGATKAWFTITLRDGYGRPVPGRQVQLASGQASVSGVSTTDIQGQARAYAVSSQVGDAEFLGKLYDKATCEFVHNAAATIAFAAPGEYGLLPAAQAPYFSDEIQVSPKPIVVGVPVTISATLSNTNDFSVTVDSTFSFQGAHIGLPFLPVSEVTGTVIPANSSTTVRTVWLPTASGHYCFAIETIAHTPGGRTPFQESSKAQLNADIEPAPFLGPEGKTAAQKANAATDAIGDAQFALGAATDLAGQTVGFIQDQLFGNILDFIYDGGNSISCAMGGGTSCGGWKGPQLQLPGDSLGNLGEDPPSQSYKAIVTTTPIPFTPLLPGQGLPAASAAALNAVIRASLELLNNLFATVAAYDRYAGAAAANDLEWQSLQASAHLHYLGQAAAAMFVTADAIDALLQEIHAEGLTDVAVSSTDFRAYQDRLRTQGYTADEVEAGHLVGFNDVALASIRARRLAIDPATMNGSVLQSWSDLATALRQLGLAIYAPPAYGVSVGRQDRSGARAWLQAMRW